MDTWPAQLIVLNLTSIVKNLDTAGKIVHNKEFVIKRLKIDIVYNSR